MLGGGIYTKQNKVLPGTYINFVSAEAKKEGAVRGVIAMPVILSWGTECEIMKVTRDTFEEESLTVLGYPRTAPQMLPFREMFRNASLVYVYRLNSSGVKASNDYAEAMYSGQRGNDIRLIIRKNVEDESLFDVSTMVDMTVVDSQTVAEASELETNGFVTFKKDAALTETSGVPLSGGADGSVTGAAYQDFLNAIEQKNFQVVGCPTKDESTINLFIAYTKRMREELGIKIQAVVYRAADADYEGVISVENSVLENEPGLVYWTTGAAAGCAVNKSNTNKVYDGEYTVKLTYTQTQLSDAIKNGKFIFHQVGDEVRILRDINSLVSFTENKDSDFADNQTIRVLDTIGNEVAALFTENFMGRVLNNDSGRVSLWNEIVTICKALASQQAIEPVDSENIIVTAGESKRSVVVNVFLQPVNCMDQMYMTVIVE